MPSWARNQLEALERGLFAAVLLGLAVCWLGFGIRYVAPPGPEVHARVPAQAERAP